MEPDNTNRSELKKLLKKHFTLEELKTLCFDLEIPYEDLPGTTRDAKSRELITYCERNGRLPSLKEAVQKKSSHDNQRDLKGDQNREKNNNDNWFSKLDPRVQAAVVVGILGLIGTIITVVYDDSSQLISPTPTITITALPITLPTPTFTPPPIPIPAPEEPNDTMDHSVPITVGIVFRGFANDQDDWYKFELEDVAKVNARLEPYLGQGHLVLYDEERVIKGNVARDKNAGSSDVSLNFITEVCLPPGTYFLRLSSDPNLPYSNNEYKITYSIEYCTLP